MDWLLEDIWNIWLNLELWVIRGGVVSVGVVIFLMGVFKKFVGNRIHNKLVRKTVLSFLSVIMVAPVTAIYLAVNTAHGLDYFWYIYALNAAGTVIVYWFYENTHIRELLYLVGKSTVGKILEASLSKHVKVKQVEKSPVKEAPKSYNEDDLKNL